MQPVRRVQWQATPDGRLQVVVTNTPTGGSRWIRAATARQAQQSEQTERHEGENNHGYVR